MVLRLDCWLLSVLMDVLILAVVLWPICELEDNIFFIDEDLLLDEDFPLSLFFKPAFLFAYAAVTEDLEVLVARAS